VAEVVAKEASVRKWGKYLPAVALLFPGGLLIVGAWLVVEYIRHAGDRAEDHGNGPGDACQGK
jgi:hypothetical protein